MSKLTLLGLVGSTALIIIGVYAVIFSLPAIINSLLYFTLFFGSGILIGYKLKCMESLFLGLGIAAWLYALSMAWMSWLYNYFALFFDSLKIVIPVTLLGALAFTWLIQKKISLDKETFVDFMIHAFFISILVVPFAVGGILDYNIRADTGPPQALSMVIVNKFKTTDDEEGDVWWVVAETLDGRFHFQSVVPESFYRDHEIGSLCQVNVRRGALGYQWMAPFGIG